jgi:leader peptidase (prepilin peptidase)/N-methyltransferase
LTRVQLTPQDAPGMIPLDPRSLLEAPAFETMALLLGLIVGSFANVCIHRLPREPEPAAGRFARLRELARQAFSVVHPGSRCPACGAAIRPWDNVPVVSWLALRGRCRSCRAPIALRYPLVEAANGGLWLGLAVLRGPELATLVEAFLVTALLVLMLIDLEHQLLPDVITLPGTACGLLASLLPGSRVAPLASVVAALAGYLGFRALAWAWRRLRGVEALGEGDWKLAAMLGAFLGGQQLLLLVFLASTSGSLVGLVAIGRGRGGWQSRLPFGTFLGAAGIVVVFWGERLLGAYRAVQGG